MTYYAKVGSFNIDTTKELGQTQAISSVGFEPKIVLFWWSGSTATGDEVAGGNINIGFGAAIDSTHRFCVVGFSQDAQVSSDTYSSQNSSEVMRGYTDSAVVDGIMDFSSMDADGFTLIVDDQFTQAYRISYLALGGDDLTNVYIGNQAMRTSAGTYGVTGIGFQPDLLIISSPLASTVESYTLSGLGFTFGIATGSSSQGVNAILSASGQATSFTNGYGYNGEIAASTTGIGVTNRETFVSFDSDGFTLNHLEGSSATRYMYICLKGGQYAVGDLTTRTDGNDISETVGFQPVALLFTSVNRALDTQDTMTDHARMSIGAANATDHRAVAAVSDEDNLDDSETAHANYDSAVYANILDDAIIGLMDLKSIESDGFTCVMDDTDPSACWVTYLAIGEEGGGECVNVVVETESVSITVPVVVVDFCEV